MKISGVGSSYQQEMKRVTPEELHARRMARMNHLAIDLAAARARGDVAEIERLSAAIGALN